MAELFHGNAAMEAGGQDSTACLPYPLATSSSFRLRLGRVEIQELKVNDVQLSTFGYEQKVGARTPMSAVRAHREGG